MGKHTRVGMAAGLALLGVYFFILTIANGPEHALTQFSDMWFLILPLAVGFGVQMGLFSFIRSGMKIMASTAATSGGVSAGSMVACCVHHVTDVVPVLGATALGLFLLQYQTAFMLLGILSNVVGITMMLHLIQRHSLQGGRFPGVFRFNMLRVRNSTFMFSVFIFVGFVALTAISAPQAAAQQPQGGAQQFPVKSNSGNGLVIDATPTISREGVSIALRFNTHSGSLDYDFTKVAEMADSDGNRYQPVQWDGPPPGGHHISGKLLFPPLKGSPFGVKLTLRNVYDVPERVFEWNLG